MNASIELIVAENKNVLALPANAVATLNGNSVVERPRSSRSEPPRFEKVKTGLVTDLWVELAGEELKEGDPVLEIDFAKLDLKRLAEGKLGEKTTPQNQRAENPR
jgi:hypothetical protein